MNESTSTQTRDLIAFFVIAFAFSWAVWLIGVLNSNGVLVLPVPNMAWVVIGAHGPLVGAVAMTWRNGGWAAVGALLRSGFRLRMKLIWWIVILLVPPILGGLAVWANIATTGYEPDTTLLSQPLMLLPTFIFMFFLGGSFQEEFGWRGYVLPRMLERWNPLVASTILGLIWGVWHLPLFYISDASQIYMPFGIFIALTIPLSLLFTWVYLRTGRNLFSALLLHTAINTSMNLFPPIEPQVGGNQMALTYLCVGYYLLIAVIVFRDRPLWLQKQYG